MGKMGVVDGAMPSHNAAWLARGSRMVLRSVGELESAGFEYTTDGPEELRETTKDGRGSISRKEMKLMP